LFEGYFELPELRPISSTRLANIRDFKISTTSFDNSDIKSEIIAKFAGRLHQAIYPGSIFNVAS
jgi:homogentisate 1,2-dioxygenase